MLPTDSPNHQFGKVIGNIGDRFGNIVGNMTQQGLATIALSPEGIARLSQVALHEAELAFFMLIIRKSEANAATIATAEKPNAGETNTMSAPINALEVKSPTPLTVWSTPNPVPLGDLPSISEAYVFSTVSTMADCKPASTKMVPRTR